VTSSLISAHFHETCQESSATPTSPVRPSWSVTYRPAAGLCIPTSTPSFPSSCTASQWQHSDLYRDLHPHPLSNFTLTLRFQCLSALVPIPHFTFANVFSWKSTEVSHKYSTIRSRVLESPRCRLNLCRSQGWLKC